MSSNPMREPSDSFPRNYMLVCGETGQLQQLRGYDCNFAELFLKRVARNDIWFWNTFAKPVEGITRVQRHMALANTQRPTPLERLPNELLDLILDCLTKNRPSVLALALASPTLYPKILARLHRGYARGQIASWAGKEIAFYGCNAPVAPNPLLKFRANLDTFAPGDEEPWYYDWGWVSAQLEYPWRKSLADARERWKELGKALWRNVDQDLSQEYLYPQDRVWVLRNLSKRQYVRSNRLGPPKAILEDELLPAKFRRTYMVLSSRRMYGVTAPFSIHPRDRSLDPLTLPQVLLVLTAYSAHPDWREEAFGSVYGPWVSDALEVFPLEEHERSVVTTREWQDVSIEVAADVGHLRWCVMQHAALSQNGVDGLWEKLKEFEKRVPAARDKWMRWRKGTTSEDSWDEDSELWRRLSLLKGS